MIRVGLVVNPVAGLGGPTGDKGSDAVGAAQLASGVTPTAPQRALRVVEGTRDVSWLTVPGSLGVDHPKVRVIDGPSVAMGQSTAADTVAAARALIAEGIDVLCFAGGDGTATDLARALGPMVPALGIPAGVKITSPVFVHAPEEAAWLLDRLPAGFETIERDVTDLDEAAYRNGRVETVLTGSLLVPLSPAVQGGKVATTTETPLDGIVDMALSDWPDGLHILGAGSVCMALKRQFWGDPTLLGVDVVEGTRILAQDVDATRLEEILAKEGPVHLWLTLIGGQGVVLGRGTQVLTPRILRRIGWENLHVVAPPEKLVGLPGIYIDTGDPELDASAPKFVRVIAGYNETRMVRVLARPSDADKRNGQG